MPTDVRFNIPFLPQQSITESILGMIQLANVEHAARVQQQLAQQAQPSEIALRQAEAARYTSQTELEKMQLQMRKDLLGELIGTTPGAQPVEQAAPAAQPAPANPSSVPAPSGPAASAAGQVTGPGQTPLSLKDFASPADFFKALAARSNQPAPAPAPAPFKGRGLIGQTVNSLLQDPSLTQMERQAVSVAGRKALLTAYAEPEKSLDGVVSTYNDVLKQHGEMARTIHIETLPDSKSSTGYSQVATHADGTEAYRHIAPPPMPKNLEEASSYLGSASFNYQREPTPGNKAALDLVQGQHDLMNRDRIAEAARQAQATSMAQGRDYDAMVRTGVNPITKERLSLNNAPPGALVNPTTGQPVPQDMVGRYTPTMNERQTADTARQVLAISQDLKNEIAKNPSLIGPLAGRSQEALQKIGISARDASKLIDDVTFLQSAATKMHTGRFSNAILEKMSGVIKPGMNRDEFLGALDSINDVAGRYANEDHLTTVYEYQQRQQFEGQGAAATGNPFVPGQFSPNNPFAPKR